MKALAEFDVEPLEHVPLFKVFDPFSDKFNTSDTSKVAETRDQRWHLTRGRRFNENSIKLKLGERQLHQPFERRVSTTEIIDRQADAKLANPSSDGEPVTFTGEVLRLGDLDGELLR